MGKGRFEGEGWSLLRPVGRLMGSCSFGILSSERPLLLSLISLS